MSNLSTAFSGHNTAKHQSTTGCFYADDIMDCLSLLSNHSLQHQLNQCSHNTCNSLGNSEMHTNSSLPLSMYNMQIHWLTASVFLPLTFMMMLWHRKAICFIDPFWWESTIHWWISLTKGQWCRALSISLMLAWTICLTNRWVVDYLRCNCTHMTSWPCILLRSTHISAHCNSIVISTYNLPSNL